MRVFVRGSVVVSLGALLALGCSGSSGGGGGGNFNTNPGSTAQNANVAGNYSGSEDLTYQNQGTAAQTALTLDGVLTQNGNQVTGSFTNSGGGIGSLSGTISGNTLTFTGSQAAPAGVTLQGSGMVGTVNGKTMISGSASGNDPQQGPFSATFSISQ